MGLVEELSRMKVNPKLVLGVLGIEVVLGLLQIVFEPTYSFDWDAYMEQVTTVVEGGQYDYSKLRGDTGPLVYPGGFVAVYYVLSELTAWDYVHETTEYVPKNISGYDERTLRPVAKMFAVQLIFLALYLCVIGIIVDLCRKTKTMPQGALLLVLASRRIRSIFFLGFYNDCFAMTFAFLAVWFFVKDRWAMGCVLYSFAVSIKMNVLLFAPSLLLLLLKRFGARGAIEHIGLCAAVQLVVGLPFLLSSPTSYVAGAFNMGRKFDLEWSVNFRFLPEDVLRSGLWAITLLGAHLSTLFVFATRKWCKHEGGILAAVTGDRNKDLSPEHIVTVLFTGNFIGVMFARSLHYQFLVWYFHTLPYLMWRTKLPTYLKIAAVLGIEALWNEHPPQPYSAAVLQCVHVIVLVALYFGPSQPPEGASWRDR